MNETMIGYMAIGALLGLVAGCLFWMLGGRAKKWRRRIVGSIIIATTTLLGTFLFGLFELSQLLLYLSLFVGFSFGYGGDNLVEKVIRRTTFAVAVVASGVLMSWTIGGNAWFLLILHAFIGAGTIFFAWKNPIHAAAEEVVVCFLLNGILVFYPFVV